MLRGCPECTLTEEDLAPAASVTAAAAASALANTGFRSFGFKSTQQHVCPVCGDQITGNHYGVNTCESCKGFFKRTAKKPKAQLKCVNGSNSCPMSIEARKLCSKCRYDKCLAVGMSEGAKSRITAVKDAGGAVSESFLPSMMATRTRTIKRRFIDYTAADSDEQELDADSPAPKRPNAAYLSPDRTG